MKTMYAFGLALLVSFMATAQTNRNFTESINHYITINGTEQQYSEAVDQLFVLLQQQYANAGVADAVWTSLKEEKTTALNQIKVMLASAYRSHFEQKDVEGMISFYESPAGKQMIADPTAMTNEQHEAYQTFINNTEVGQKLTEQQASLSRMIGQISESWSSNLYLNMKEDLAGEGYVLN